MLSFSASQYSVLVRNRFHIAETLCLNNAVPVFIQGGAEPTDTFQTVMDNIWKQGKICETVYKYVQVCYLLPTNYKLIF